MPTLSASRSARIDAVPVRSYSDLVTSLSTRHRDDLVRLDLPEHWVTIRAICVVPKRKKCAAILCKNEFNPTRSYQKYCCQRCRKQMEYQLKMDRKRETTQ